jgi:hypothetical protein
MKIQGKMSGELVKFLIKANQANDGKSADVDLSIRTTRVQAPERFGEEVAELAFATTREVETAEGSQGWEHLQDRIKPGRIITVEQHSVTIEGDTVVTKPKLLRIEPVKGEESCWVFLRLTLDATDAKLMAALSGLVGEALSLVFEEQQMQLGFE